MSSEIKKLSSIEHMLCRPGMYIGSTKLKRSEEFYFDTDNITKKEIEYVPAFIKIFREIVDNSIDENIRTKGEFANKIEIDIDKNRMSISIKDNGRGLSSLMDETHKVPKAVLAFTEARAGSNFADDTGTIGQNGIGAFGTAVFSKLFEFDTSDGIKRTRGICKNNLSDIVYKQTNSSKKFTKIKFIPDYKKISMDYIDDTHYNIIYKNILDLSLAFQDIKFYFNGKIIKNKNFRDYVKLYSDDFECFSYNNIDIAVCHHQEWEQVSFVNGINTVNGGTHVDYIINNISYKLRDILQKKYKTIKPIDIKNNCFFIINIKNMIAPRFDSQLKENLTNDTKDVISTCAEVEFDTISVKLSKNDIIGYPIIESFKMKEELKKRSELKNEEKKILKKKVIPKLIEANSKIRSECSLFITEGDSANGMAITVRNSDTQAFYPISGKFVNCYDVSAAELIKKKNVTEFLSVMGLKLTSSSIKDLNYGKIIIMTDEDTDGAAIAALLINFFFKFWPDLIKEERLFKVQSYLILGQHKETKKEKKFYSIDEFKEVEDEYKLLEFNKGLGSLDKESYEEALNNLILLTDDNIMAKDRLKIAFSKEGDRKTWMQK